MNLFGRRNELRAVQRQFSDVQRGESGFLLVDGARGSGKSSLVGHVVSDAAKRGIRVVTGPSNGHRPLLLAGALAAGAARFAGIPRRPRGHPEIGGWPQEAFEAAVEAELNAPDSDSTGPVLIALDDVDWEDPDVGFLLAAPPARTRRPVLWLLSGPTPPSRSSPLEGARNIGAVRLTLGPLGGRDVTAMAAEALGGTPDAGLGGLLEACGGHPGLLRALLNELIAWGGCTVRQGVAGWGAGPLPRRVLTALLREDPRLSGGARALAMVAAAQPNPMRTSELTRIPEQDVLLLLRAVREVVEAGVLRIDRGRLGFHHSLVREAATRLLSPAARSRLMARFGVAPSGLFAVPVPAGASTSLLSPAERTIAEQVARGLTNRQIASRMDISPHTVNFHLRKIFRKLRVSSRVEMVGTYLHVWRPEQTTTAVEPIRESRAADAK